MNALPRTRLVAILGGVLATAVVATGCSASGDAGGDGELAPVTFSSQPVFDSALPIAADALGYFEDAGIRLESFRTTGDLAAQISLAAEGSVDIVSMVPEVSLPAAITFPDTSWISVNDIWYGGAFMQREDGSLKTYDQIAKQDTNLDESEVLRATLDQFEGLTLITNYEQESQGLVNLFEAAGIKEAPDEFMDVQSMASPQGVTAFLRGEGDLFVGSLPERYRVQEFGGVPVTSALEWPSLPGTVYYVGWYGDDKWIDENEDTVLRVLGAQFRVARDLSVRTLDADPTQDAALEPMLEWVNEESGSEFTLEYAREVNAVTSPWFTVEEAGEVLFAEQSDRNFQNYLDTTLQFLTASGSIDGDVDVVAQNRAAVLYDTYVGYGDEAATLIADLKAQGLSGEAAELLEKAEHHYDILNFVDAAAFAQQAADNAG